MKSFTQLNLFNTHYAYLILHSIQHLALHKPVYVA